MLPLLSMQCTFSTFIKNLFSSRTTPILFLLFQDVSLHSALSTVGFVLPYSLIKKHIRQLSVNEKKFAVD